MEKEALKPLTAKQKLFCSYYTTVANFNATKAHKMAGYSAKNYDTRRAAASKLLTKVNVKAEIDRILTDEHEKNLVLKTKIRRRYEAIAFASIDQIIRFGASFAYGMKSLEKNTDAMIFQVPNLNDIPEELRQVIKRIKKTKVGFEIELYDAPNAMKELRQMYGLDKPLRHEIAGQNGDPININQTIDLTKLTDKELEVAIGLVEKFGLGESAT